MKHAWIWMNSGSSLPVGRARIVAAGLLWSVAAGILLIAGAGTAAADETGDEKADERSFSAATFSGLELRCLGPAKTGGRISDFAVHPEKPWIYYVAVSSGNVWKTENAGTTFEPIFEDYGSYSIGCITMDPNDPFTLWLGTGENNSQRAVGFGDGVYKSIDGGRTWTNMGLEDSQHIGMIAVDPRDSRVVYVAAQGPLWSPGGDRGLYKTTDGGATWAKALEISEDTGVSEVHMDPRNPDVLYAAAYQRRRHVWTQINGGPESAVYKSTDAGASWTKLTRGLPGADMGRIGLAISPANPDVVYAIIEAALGQDGFFRSADGGQNWEKRSGYHAHSPQYYQEIFADPHDVDRVYSMDVRMKVTEDGGKTWTDVGRRAKHVDDHALWIDPHNTDHLLCGCDGGIYETWERGATWDFKSNLPIAQFYRVSVDQAEPFYHVYGGTQDNNSLRAPSRTISASGITNADWIITTGGDGYETQVDPTDSNIIYAQSQYGGLVRYDFATGETVDIQPQPAKGEPELRWNWDTPLLLSPHSPTRLYYAANKLFRTDDRGNSWQAVSPDLTRQIDRNQLEVMGELQSVDAVAKHWATSFYGNCVALAESPLVEGLLYVGTDDGLIQVSEDGGASWREVERVKGVPERTYVSELTASRHDPHTVFATFNNHKNGDFKPYVYRSDDRGRSWRSISGNLPERGMVWCLEQDHVNEDLLFAGTEFGLYFTADGGKQWLRLKGNFPVIEIRDLDIQRRENDLAVGTFGRGIYVLDDYSPLREVSPERLTAEDALLFPVKDAWLYHEKTPLGGRGKANQGDNFYYAENPPYGVVFTYYLKESLQTLAQKRRDAEEKAKKEGERIGYPDWDELRAEDRERAPEIWFHITDESGELVRQIKGSGSRGIHRVAWDMHYPPVSPASTKPWSPSRPWSTPPRSHLAAPGRYAVTLVKREGDVTTPLAGPRTFQLTPLGWATLPTEDWEGLHTFQRQVADLHRSVQGAIRTAGEAKERLEHIRVALRDTPGIEPKRAAALADRTRSLELRLTDLRTELDGDRTISKRHEPGPVSIRERISQVVWGSWESTSDPTQTHRDNYAIASERFAPVLERLTRLVEEDLTALEADLEEARAPWTPGRVPTWR